MEATVRELLAAAQANRKAKLDAGRVDTVFKVGDRVLLRTKALLDAADAVGRSLHGARLPEPQRQHPRAATSHALQPDRQRRPPLFSPVVPSGRPITVVPLKQRAGWRVGHSRTQRPAGPCEAASSDESTIAAPEGRAGPRAF